MRYLKWFGLGSVILLGLVLLLWYFDYQHEKFIGPNLIPEFNKAVLKSGNVITNDADAGAGGDNENAVVRKIEEFSVISSKVKDEMLIKVDTSELRSFVGTDLQNADLTNAEPMSMGLGFADSMQEKAKSHVFAYVKPNKDENGFLKNFEVIIENTSNNIIVVRLPMMPAPGISIHSRHTNNGYLDARAYLKDYVVQNDRIGIFIPLESKHFRAWKFPVEDILLKRQDLIQGASEKVIIVMTMSGFVEVQGKKEYFPINYVFEINNAKLKLPVEYDAYEEFNIGGFANSAFSQFLDQYSNANQNKP